MTVSHVIPDVTWVGGQGRGEAKDDSGKSKMNDGPVSECDDSCRTTVEDSDLESFLQQTGIL